MFKNGDTVRLIQPVIEGEIVEGGYNNKTNKLQHKVVCKINGEEHQVWLDVDKLELVKAAPTEEEAAAGAQEGGDAAGESTTVE